MKSISIFSILSLFAILTAQAQDYMQIVTFESKVGTNAIFTSAGASSDKKEVETNAIQSLFYTLFYQGVEGVNNGKPLVREENEMYTKPFFNQQARYAYYVTNSETVGKTQKVGALYQGTVRVTVRIDQLVREVQKNTAPKEKPVTVETMDAKPTIIVVPFKKNENESYSDILKNDPYASISIAAVSEGLIEKKIEIRNLQGVLDGRIRQGLYDTRSASSNDKELLRSSGADVYIVTKVEPSIKSTGSSVAMELVAYQTGTGIEWARSTIATNEFRTNNVKLLCKYAVDDEIGKLIDQITLRYLQPTKVQLDIYTAGASMHDICNSGRRIIDEVKRWLARNAENGDYRAAGDNADYARFDYVIIPKKDKEGLRMDASMFLGELAAYLRTLGVGVVDGSTITEGGIIQLTIE